jgi:hypothetical protein
MMIPCLRSWLPGILLATLCTCCVECSLSIEDCAADATKLEGNQCRCPAGSLAHC